MSATERLLSVSEAKAIDIDAVDRLGMPTQLLMENAAIGVATMARKMGDRFVIFCGRGNNGGDGLAVARQLGLSRCQIHLLSEPDPERSPDASLQLDILRRAGADLHLGVLPDFSACSGAVWIDALFGTGLDRVIDEPARSWVEAWNQAHGQKLSVDIPSGLHGDSGEVLGVACRSDVTVTFVAQKRGMATASGREHCGRVEVVGLGLP